MTQVLVKRLRDALRCAQVAAEGKIHPADHVTIEQSLKDAITALSRPRLPEGWEIVLSDIGIGIQHTDGGAAGIVNDEDGVRLTVLRRFLSAFLEAPSNGQSGECEHVWSPPYKRSGVTVRHCLLCANPTPPSPPSQVETLVEWMHRVLSFEPMVSSDDPVTIRGLKLFAAEIDRRAKERT